MPSTLRTLLLLASIAWPAMCAADEPIDFRTDIVPILTKLGCNSGACHGAAAGRGEFHLSLYGSRPGNDYDAIVREFRGRRVNLTDASRSLILRKPGGELDHEGGFLIDGADDSCQILKSWIRQGASPGSLSGRQLVKFETPRPSISLTSIGESHQLTFRATFENGTVKDVTQWTVVTTNDSSAVQVDSRANVITVLRPGRHVLVARFLNRVIPVEFIIPFEGTPQPVAWKLNRSLIDDEINARLNQLQLSAVGASHDFEFLRRISLHLTGGLPTPEEVAAFEANKSATKREEVIKRFLNSDHFVDYWTFQLAELLRIRTQPADRIGAQTYHDWLRDQLVQNRGWDAIVRQLLLSSGDTHLVGEANFYRTGNGAREQTEFVSEALMGVTLRCANCHDHPFDRWTQDDYHGLAAVFAKTKQGRVVEPNPLGINTNPLTGQPAFAKLPGSSPITKSPGEREAFTEWLTDKGNPYFARAIVNRIWKALMGRGLVEPVDDIRLSNPATHPELLNRLSADFIAHNFNIRHTINLICQSDAYQRSRAEVVNINQAEFYGARHVQRLPAEVLADAICAVTGIPEHYPGEPVGTMAIQLFDSQTESQALDVLGRCSREESCESRTTNGDVGLSSQLHLMNGDLINEKLANESGRLSQLIKHGASDSEIVTEFYLRSFCRKPTERELTFWLKEIAAVEQDISSGDRRERLEDFVWSLCNSREFYSNL